MTLRKTSRTTLGNRIGVIERIVRTEVARKAPAAPTLIEHVVGSEPTLKQPMVSRRPPFVEEEE